MYTYSAVVDIHCNTSLAKISSRDIDFMESIFEVIFKSWSGSGRLAGLGELNLDYGKRGGLSQHSFRLNKSVTQIYEQFMYNEAPEQVVRFALWC